jgi:hypothetical protein
MADPVIEELPVPFDANMFGGKEIARAFVVNGDLHVTLDNAFEDSAVWGVMLADIARHIVTMRERETGEKRDKILGDIRQSLDAEWSSAADGP